MSGYTGSAYQGFGSWNSAFNGDISKWDTSQVTICSYVLASSSFNRHRGLGHI